MEVDGCTQIIHNLCMTTRTISLRLEAYERLRRAKRSGESFSDVVMRASFEGDTVTAAEWLRWRREHGPLFDTEELDRIEAAKCADRPPEDKWRTR